MERRILIGAVAAFLLSSAAAAAAPSASIDAAARDYVRLQVAIGEKEDGYLDGYYGPLDLKLEGKKLGANSDLRALESKAEALRARIAKLGAQSRGLNGRRSQFLAAQLTAAVTRLRMMQGDKLSFDDEALGLFAVRPRLKPLSAFDPVLARLERLVPGPGPLADRVDAYQNRFTIKPQRLRAVFEAAIAACRARTRRFIRLPRSEHFALGFVTGKTWGAYNYYLGNYTSRIDVNTDLPSRIEGAVNYGCHEGYPGHHVLNSLLEQRLRRGRGWIEFSVDPLYSPQSFIEEGSANYGIRLAFPVTEKTAFDARRLYPLAGLPAAEAVRYDAVVGTVRELQGARMTIAREFLDGGISEQQAIELQRKYGVTSEERARHWIGFVKQYRSYVINYGLGEEMVRADVEARRTRNARWKRFEQIISQPTLPSDLRPDHAAG